MGYFRACDICGEILDSNLMNFVSTTSKTGGNKDICTECLSGRVIVSMPGEKVLRGSEVLMTEKKEEIEKIATISSEEVKEILSDK